MSLTFDTLGFAKHLRDAGIDRDHAEAHATAARDFIMSELVTKTDLREAMLTLTVRIGGMVAGSVGLAVAVLAFLIRTHS